MAIREVRDADGREWMVWAVYPTPTISGRILPNQRAAIGWLAFECGDERRRLYDHPDDWEERSDEQLISLCESAEVVGIKTATKP